MNRKKTLSILGGLALCPFVANAQVSPPQPQAFGYSPNFQEIRVDASRLARVDALLREYVDKGILPHALTFVAREGQVIHHKAFGYRDMEKKIPLREDDIFRMYSQTKAIVTTALMTLFEQGKFQLDDPVSKYIPEMTNQVVDNGEKPNAVHPRTREAVSPVLIRHLMSHTSGISHIRREHGTKPKEYATLADYVKDLVQAPLVYDPGTGWNYHPASDVCAYLVELFSGKSLREYLEEALFAPLGITDMAYYYDKSYAARFVNIYQEKEGRLQPVTMWSGREPFGDDRRFAQGGTGLNGTIEGYARFCQMILNGGTFNGKRVLGRRTIEVMAKNQIVSPRELANNFRFGLGFQIYRGDGKDWEVQTGDSPMISGGSLSWGGMANTDYLIDREQKMIVLLYTNRIPDTKVWEKFLNTVYQALE
ncbi:MAG: beta-lactamase family protein [Mediterranea sp.]|jgi:CubicO group peptidase (beta-lactamase class C family)|nr:beta-lactamase family protein [Mediterranea sp.]